MASTKFCLVLFFLFLIIQDPVYGRRRNSQRRKKSKPTIDSTMRKVKDDTPAGKKLKSQLASLKDKANSEENQESVDAGLSAVSDSVEGLQSQDPAKIALACLEIISAVAGAFDQLGAIGMVLGLVSTLISMFSGGEVQESMEDCIKRALKEQRDDELEAEAYGTKRIFTVSKAFLDGIRETEIPLSTQEVAALSANVPIYQGVKFIAMLVQRIGNAEPKDENGAKRVLTFMELLVDLCSVRDVLLMDMYRVVASAKHSPSIAAGIKGVQQLGRKEFRKTFQKLLLGNNPKHWVLLSYLYPRDRSTQTIKIHTFLEYLEVDDLPRIDVDLSGQQIISSLKYPNHCIAAQSDTEELRGDYWKEEQGKNCKATLTQTNDGFYTISFPEVGNANAYATEAYAKQSPGRTPDKLSKFNLIPVSQNNRQFYLWSSCEWPNKFFYSQANKEGYIASYEGNPNTGGYQSKAYFTIQSPSK